MDSAQSLSRVQLFATPWTAAHQASLSITNSQFAQTHVQSHLYLTGILWGICLHQFCFTKIEAQGSWGSCSGFTSWKVVGLGLDLGSLAFGLILELLPVMLYYLWSPWEDLRIENGQWKNGDKEVMLLVSWLCLGGEAWPFPHPPIHLKGLQGASRGFKGWRMRGLYTQG